ncbi:MAG: hypothetical protein ACXABY_10805 [Candidatus Thorarchaeota archaeon]|jgi:hypothetical protein
METKVILPQCGGDGEKYIKEWRALGHAMEKIFGGKLYAFDPDICLAIDGRTLTIERGVAHMLAVLYLRVEQLEGALRNSNEVLEQASDTAMNTEGMVSAQLDENRLLLQQALHIVLEKGHSGELSQWVGECVST